MRAGARNPEQHGRQGRRQTPTSRHLWLNRQRWRTPLAALIALALTATTAGYAYAAQPAAEAPDATVTTAAPDTAVASTDVTTNTNAPALAAAAGCDAVTTWAQLKSCLEDTSVAAVMLTAKIVVPTSDGNGSTIEIANGHKVTLTAADGAGLTGIDADGGTVARQTSVFHVAKGGELTIASGSYERISSTGDGPLAKVEGILTVTGGTFSGNGTVGGSGGVFRAEAGSTVTFGVDGGKDSPVFESNSAVNGGVIYSRGAVAVKSGLYEGNKATGTGGGQGGGAIHLKEKASTLNIESGTFKNNESAGEGGGAIYSLRSEKLSVSAGLFEGNMATNDGDNRGGGAIYANATSLSITGGKFYGNGQEPAPGQQCGTSNSGKCWSQHSGGGAIYSTGGSLVIQGGVEFRGNYAKARSWYSGGGAIWAQGEMWIRNSADASQTKPVFSGNWASIQQPTAEASKKNGVSTELTGAASEIAPGGAGGAVFLNNNSTAYITGGSYVNNASGYLGGGIYTEEGTTTYVSKAVAYENTAGHFGGGLWFCPSGNSAASKGGNIALFGNKVDYTLDANAENDSTEGKSETMAGDDLAIMNPYEKSDGNNPVKNNKFQLMDTWFTDRSNSVTDWYLDGTPDKKSSGFRDKYLGSSNGRQAVLTHDGGAGYPQRYKDSETSKDNKMNIDASSHALMLCLAYTQGKNVGDTTAGCAGYESFVDRGVALKAVLTGTREEQQTAKDTAKNSAQITITGNGARLSGGGFGSDGVVIFDSPYSMEWQKANAYATDPSGSDDVDLVDSASTWTLSTNDAVLDPRKDGDSKSPYMSMDLRPTQCQAKDQSTLPDDCWRHNEETGAWTVDIVDNGIRDNDNEKDKSGKDVYGSIAVDNLAPGTYILKEKYAPVGYQLSTTEYTFTVTAAETNNTLPQIPTLSIIDDTNDQKSLLSSDGHTIGDYPITGKLTWTKIDDKNVHIGGSSWTIELITRADGTTESNRVSWPIIITDNCESDTSCSQDNQNHLDEDNSAGGFQIDVADSQKYPDGTYKLTEKTAPEGYWIQANSSRRFTISTDENNNRVVTWNTGENGQFVNKPTEVSWTKVDSASGDVLKGSEWEIRKTKTAGGNKLDSDKQQTWKVLDCKSDTSGCNTSTSTWADSDEADGKFRLEKLTPGTYTLTETKAPDGYIKSDKTYTFTIGETQPTAEIAISVQNGDTTTPVTDNKIGNAKAVSVLPLTGANTARAWMSAGGMLLAAAGLAAAAEHVRRQRRGIGL